MKIVTMFQSTRPRRARPAIVHHLVVRACFNPRAREGRDLSGVHRPHLERMFQSTRPRRARRATGSARSWSQRGFQSTRPRRARRRRAQAIALGERVSIHAPAKGATCASSTAGSMRLRFNPRAREGRDLPVKSAGRVLDMFQSTRPRRARRACLRAIP